MTERPPPVVIAYGDPRREHQLDRHCLDREYPQGVVYELFCDVCEEPAGARPWPSWSIPVQCDRCAMILRCRGRNARKRARRELQKQARAARRERERRFRERDPALGLWWA